MESYKLLLFLHIVFVIVGLGSTFALPFLQAMAQRKGVATTRFFHEFAQRLERMVIIPGAVLVFLMGIGLYFDDVNAYNDSNPAWLTISMAWFVIAFLVGVFVMHRTVGQALKTLEGVPDSAPLPAEYESLAKREQIVGGLLGLSILGIAFLMVWKPGD